MCLERAALNHLFLLTPNPKLAHDLITQIIELTVVSHALSSVVRLSARMLARKISGNSHSQKLTIDRI